MASDEQFMAAPPRDKVARAIAKSRADGADGQVMKVIYLDSSGEPVGEWASQQMPEDPFSETMDSLQAPPYSLEQLVFLAESHPVHSSALEQLKADVCGEGYEWVATSEESIEEEKDAIDEWWRGLAPEDEDIEEIISAAYLDKATVGWGAIEVVRDPDGIARRLYHIPGHTLRAAKDGFRLCQAREEKKVWFRRWGATDIEGNHVFVDSKTGHVSTEEIKNPANDVLIIRSLSRRSSWYGIPGYVSGIGWITLALAARDDNIMFFHNRREPRWAIILSGLAEDGNVQEDIRRAFTVDLKQPYRNIIVPLKGKDGKIEFEKLSETSKDGSFEKLSQRADRAILVSHRVPPERVAAAEVGPLGGNNIFAANRIYKDAVVDPEQRMLASRLNKFISREYPLTKSRSRRSVREILVGKVEKPLVDPSYKLELTSLDVTDQQEDVNLATTKFKANGLTLEEYRKELGLGPLMVPLERIDPETGEPIPRQEGEPVEEVESELNHKIYTQLPGVSSYDDPSTTPEPSGPPGMQLDPALALLDADVRESLRASRDVLERLEELAER